jgi:hypothetical protein
MEAEWAGILTKKPFPPAQASSEFEPQSRIRQTAILSLPARLRQLARNVAATAEVLASWSGLMLVA